MGRNKTSMADKYINELFAPEDNALLEIRQALREDGKEGINVAPFEGRLLQVLMSLVGAKKVVEVGTLYGYSALWMARALPDDGKLYCLEKDLQCVAKAKEFLHKNPVGSKIEILPGDANQSLLEISHHGPFDMIFIDANKSAYENYLNWAEENIAPGGLIVGDNTFLFGHLTGETPWVEKVSTNMKKSVQNFNERLADPKKYRSIMIPSLEGMTVAQKL